MRDPEELDCVLNHSNDPIILRVQPAEFNIIPSIRAQLSIMQLTQDALQLSLYLDTNCDTNNTCSALKPYCVVGKLKSECHKSIPALQVDADAEFERQTLLAVHEACSFVPLVGVEPDPS
ncbi:hypothetical protein K503DRAFT_768205 [Rhizopogon vinicolor AM-OR11-026]|uniref:Uncharacterized protein n=1 Tax=Rhizopogon vinicolor AM-OR11-026 TaxID=1314800 RepID=A0A1B7N7L7_9AGAM|nr:hypothetical protein K503DRAFT_768205 [Rhizopogon vinicolor AM-OR11-026]